MTFICIPSCLNNENKYVLSRLPSPAPLLQMRQKVISSGVNFLWSCYISASGFLNGHKDFIATHKWNATDSLPWKAMKHCGVKLQRYDHMLHQAVDHCCVSDNVWF